MNKESITKELIIQHSTFTVLIDRLNKEQFEFISNKKWSAGQQLVHILKSVKPLNTYFALPNFVKKTMFGKNNSNSRSFDEIRELYLSFLDKGAKAPNEFVPDLVIFENKEKVIASITNNIEKIVASLNKMSESDLDSFQMPHPLLGKITIKEMMHFTLYHLSHHQKSVENATYLF